ncbi:unnamed protein product [Dicrocoelium dendriticum]|nr:unnamed protein product [Dicrocoelium dendriticum]
MVIPVIPASGTWQTHTSGKSTDFFRLPSSLPPAHAAVCRVNPATALLMLTDFVKLRPNDVMIQNGATSAVGIYGIQMAKHLGVKTINLFRPRSSPEATEATRQVLLDYGATWALTEAEFADSTNPMTKDAKSAGQVQLGLNCLGGRPTLTIMKVLADGGTLVSYGAMTRSPMPIPVFPLIFHDIRLRGFWVTGWLQRASSDETTRLFTQIAEWFSQGILRPSPFLEVPFSDWKKAISLTAFSDSGPSGITKKIILNME